MAVPVVFALIFLLGTVGNGLVLAVLLQPGPSALTIAHASPGIPSFGSSFPLPLLCALGPIWLPWLHLDSGKLDSAF